MKNDSLQSPGYSYKRRLIAAISRRVYYIFYKIRYYNSLSTNGLVDLKKGLCINAYGKGRLSLGKQCSFSQGVTIECGGTITIGNNTVLGHYCTLASRQSLIIGDDCMIAEMVSIRDHDHCFDSLHIPIRLQGDKVSPVKIGNNVWIGAKATIIKGVTIGDNAIIGANAVVNKNIPANTIAVGIPATVIKTRS